MKLVKRVFVCFSILGVCLLNGSCSALRQKSSQADQPPARYVVAKTFPIGGEGGWDFATLDPTGSLLFLPRTSHTQLIDTATGKVVGDIPGGGRLHGVALVPAVGRGFITDGKEASVHIFDLKTREVLGTVAAAEDADSIVYDPASDRLLVACGDAGVLVPLAPGIDPKNGKADAPIELGGKPEFLVVDGKGKVYVNLEDKAQVASVDTKLMKVLTRWSIAPGAEATGIALDHKNGRLFVGCRNQKFIVLSTQDGTVLADLPIGRGVDACEFDDGIALASCGDGTLTAVTETSPGHFAVSQVLNTAPRARTMALDPRSRRIYLPTADMEPAPPAVQGGERPRPKPIAGTFKVIVVERSKEARKAE